jgi:HSP20 family protein
MVRKIKPVSRIIKIETEIRSVKRSPLVRGEKYPNWDETWFPRVDISEKAKEIVVEAEIPGVGAADLMITVHSNRVEIKGMKKEGIISEKVRFLRLEREFGGFRRLVALPSTVVPDKAKAFLENGVLTLRLKKYLPHEEKEVVIDIPKTEG